MKGNMMKKSLFFSLVLGFTPLQTIAGETFTLTEFSAATGKAIIASAHSAPKLARQLRKELAQFKVPAQRKLICFMGTSNNHTSIQCSDIEEPKVCPKTMEFKVPGQKGSITLNLDCTGPDANGECECEVATE